MTRDEARAAFAEARIGDAALTQEALADLHGRIDLRMKESGLIGGSYRMGRPPVPQKAADGSIWAELRCRSAYFENREAVTFNPDGFVGFAGWADDSNVQPVLQGFADWVEAIRPSPAGAPSR